MWWDLLLQAAVILISVFSFLWIHDIPRKTLAKFHFYRNKSKYQAKRHFVTGAQLLSQARSTNNLSLAAAAASEADAAIRLEPTDASAHILKSIALELQGFKTSAIEALDAALSPLAVKSLSEEERADALVRRAELRRSGGNAAAAAAAAAADLKEAVRLRPEKARGWWVLGECYEAEGRRDKAKEAFEEALRVDSACEPARRGMDRLAA